MALQTVFSNNLDPANGSLTARFKHATAFYIDTPLESDELEIDVFLQVYFPTQTKERTRNLALGKLKDGQITLNETDTETVEPIPNEFLDSGLEMALFFLPSDTTYLEVFVLTQDCKMSSLCNRLDNLDKKIDDLVAANNNLNTILDLILDAVSVVTVAAETPNRTFDAASLVGEWDLANSVNDTSPDGTDNNSGRLSGSTEFIPDGDFGHVLKFAGDGYLEIPNTEDINLGNHAKRTVSVWVNADSTQPRQTIFEEGGTVRGLNIYFDQGKIYFGGWNEPDNESAWKGTFLNAEITQGWHLATLTLDATLWAGTTEANAFTAYLDGQLIGSGDGSQLWGHADPTAFGATAGATLYHDGTASAGNYLTGEIAKPKIFNRALSATEIQNLYENFS